MTLTDTGALVALLDDKDPYHMICSAAVRRLPKQPLLSTWPCLTEAMYLLHRGVGYAGQALLWKLYQDSRLVLHDLGVNEITRMVGLMEQYRDTPMDLADASLIATAEHFGLKRIFTLDSDFRFYRLADGSILEMVP